MWTDFVTTWSVPFLWFMSVTLGVAGVVRHSYRARGMHDELQQIIDENVDGVLRYAAQTLLTGERYRAGLKAGLTAFAALRLDTQVDRLLVLSPEWDWRDVVQPLVFLGILLLLTHWSNVELARRPQ